MSTNLHQVTTVKRGDIQTFLPDEKLKKKKLISSHSVPRGEWQRLVVRLSNTAGHHPSAQRPLLPNMSPRPLSLPRVVTSHMSLPTIHMALRACWARSCALNCDPSGLCQTVFIKAAAASLRAWRGIYCLLRRTLPGFIAPQLGVTTGEGRMEGGAPRMTHTTTTTTTTVSVISQKTSPPYGSTAAKQ